MAEVTQRSSVNPTTRVRLRERSVSLVQQGEPYWISAWHSSAAPGETFTHWIFWDNVGATIMSALALSMSGVLAGLIGGVVGSIARRLYLRSAA